MDLKDIYRPIASAMGSFDGMIEKEFSCEDPVLRDLGRYLVNIAGKRIRPALAIFSSRLYGDNGDIPVRLSLAVELLHTATLIHDDIIDGSTFRRHEKSLNARWGNDISIILGDYLYSRAFFILAGTHLTGIFELFSECAQRICEGELKQIERRNDLSMSEKLYRDIITKKTASLFETAALIGPTLHPTSPGDREALTQYGRCLGIAFQISDDCLDLIGNEQEMGKMPGLDLEKCDVTLPLIFLYQRLDPKERGRLEDWIGQNGARNHFREIQAWALKHGAVESSMRLAESEAYKAVRCLEGFPRTDIRTSLEALAEHIVNRVPRHETA